ncbi:MAG: DMT family transporter [Ignavibacterium sp.]|nr:DMT family transporter [Ignavibacterium sp.]
MKKYFGESALLLNTVIWGATFALIKEALDDTSPMIFVAFRFGLAALLLFPFIYKQLFKVDKQTLIAGSILGFFFFSGFATQTIGLNYTTATKSGFITGTFVVFIPILQLIIEKRKPRWFNLASILLVLVGLILLSSKGNHFLDLLDELGSDFNVGDFLTLLCAILFAFQVVYVDVFTKRHPYMPMVFIQLFITGMGGIIFALIFSAFDIEDIKLSFSSNLIFAILYTALFASILATVIQLKYQKVVSPTKAGIIYSFEPIMAALFAYFLLTEKISNFGVLGGLFIFIGLLFSEVLEKRNGKS